jgi:hypothetical protein
MENLIVIKKWKFVSTLKQNYREYAIIECVLINYKYSGPHFQYFTSFYLEANDLSSQHMYELFKQKFVSCMIVYWMLSQKILDLTSNIKKFNISLISDNVM